MTWLYLKVYCGETVADQLLAGAIGPLATELVTAGAAERWFFIRYVDPHHHLRVRFLVDQAQAGHVESALRERLAEAVSDGLVWRIVRDTYEPELERYGASTMELAECLFHHESNLVAQVVKQVRATGDEHLRWQFGLAAIDRHLEDFGYPLAERVRVLDVYAGGLLPEFGEPKSVKERIDAKARERRAHIDEALDPARRAERFGALDALLASHSAATTDLRAELLSRLAGEPSLSLDHLMASSLHMFCNRLFLTRQRLHELVLYLFLARATRGAIARLGYTSGRSSHQ